MHVEVRQALGRGEHVLEVLDALVRPWPAPLAPESIYARAPRWLSVPARPLDYDHRFRAEVILALLADRHRAGALWTEVVALKEELVLLASRDVAGEALAASASPALGGPAAVASGEAARRELRRQRREALHRKVRMPHWEQFDYERIAQLEDRFFNHD